MSKHEWRDSTPEGEVRFVRASRHGAMWKLESRLKSGESWTLVDPMPLDDLEYLREVLWNKYQRRRVPAEQIAEIDALIKAAEDRA